MYLDVYECEPVLWLILNKDYGFADRFLVLHNPKPEFKSNKLLDYYPQVDPSFLVDMHMDPMNL